jgi:hypothetical protein
LGALEIQLDSFLEVGSLRRIALQTVFVDLRQVWKISPAIEETFFFVEDVSSPATIDIAILFHDILWFNLPESLEIS